MELFPCSGILHYSGPPYRLVVDIDPELGRYYRALIPKYLHVAPSRHPMHVTVVRTEKDHPTNLSAWGKYEGERVHFLYESSIVHGKTYYWLRILCTRLEEIRLELGLGLERSKTPTDASYDAPPAPYRKFFHTTVGNNK